MANPWERQPDESEKAYAAFLCYRDLGTDRNVTDAYRQSQRKPDAKQADGTWNKWVKKHRWRDRARGWDDHNLAQVQAGIDKVSRRAGIDWETERRSAIDAKLRLGRRFLDAVEKGLAFYDPLPLVDPKDLYRLASTATKAHLMEWDAILKGLGHAESEEHPRPRIEIPGHDKRPIEGDPGGRPPEGGDGVGPSP